MAKEINGETPDQIAVRYATADLQNNIARKISLLTGEARDKQIQSAQEEGKFVEQFGPENNNQLNNKYRLTEYKLNETTFYYLLENATNEDQKYYFKIVQSPDGWRIEDPHAGDEVQYLTFQQKIQPHIIKDYEDEPIYQDLLEQDYKNDKEKGDQARIKHFKYHSPAQEKINGKTPLDIAIEAKQLNVMENYKELSKIITPAYKKYMEEDYMENRSISDWDVIDWNSTGDPSRDFVFKERKNHGLTIEEYKKNNDCYVYKIVLNNYVDVGGQFFTVKRTNEGWKIDVNTDSQGTFFGDEWKEGITPKKILYY